MRNLKQSNSQKQRVVEWWLLGEGENEEVLKGTVSVIQDE